MSKRLRVSSDPKRLARMYKALGNEHRLALFLNLIEQSRTGGGRVALEKGGHTCFLTSLLGDLRLTAPTISHHVKELADAGLIDTERDGKQLVCSLRPGVLRELTGLLGAR
jgi:ArsR family transcriptional regulator